MPIVGTFSGPRPDRYEYGDRDGRSRLAAGDRHRSGQRSVTREPGAAGLESSLRLKTAVRARHQGPGGADGTRIIVPDPDSASVKTGLFERFATGRHSLKALVSEFNAEGVTLRSRELYNSVVHQILRKRLYSGDFDWDGSTYTGRHEPLVTRECWQRVQELLDARAENKTRKVKHDFADTGLVHCGHCGCLLVGELKKGKCGGSGRDLGNWLPSLDTFRTYAAQIAL